MRLREMFKSDLIETAESEFANDYLEFSEYLGNNFMFVYKFYLGQESGLDKNILYTGGKLCVI
jgi:hypothetical protein